MQGSLEHTPFAVLSIIAAPAILTNACSVLCLGTSNRIARVVDRTRQLTGALVNGSPDAEEYAVVEGQIEHLRVRSRLLVKALRFGYTALGGFAAATLISVLGSALDFYEMHLLSRSIAFTAFAMAIFAVGSLVGSCTMMVRETVRAVSGLSEETEMAVHRLARK